MGNLVPAPQPAVFNSGYLNSGYSWPHQGDIQTALTYAFLQSIPMTFPSKGSPSVLQADGLSYNSSLELTPFEGEQITGATYAMQAWESLANISLKPTTSPTGNINLGYYRFSPADAGLTILPGTQGQSAYVSGYVALNLNKIAIPTEGGLTYYPPWYPKNLTVGSSGYWVILHEIGHALGLSHTEGTTKSPLPSSAATVPSGQSNYLYSVMSYNPDSSEYGGSSATAGLYPITPMMYDIAAIQQLYGANLNGGYHITNWQFTDSSQPFSAECGAYYQAPGSVLMTLWNNKPGQTITTSGVTGTEEIDLNPGTFCSIGLNSDTAYNVGIAQNTYINTAILGNGGTASNPDVLFGYDQSVSGVPTVVGASQNDSLVGGNGNDQITTGTGNDTVVAGTGNTTIIGGTGNDIFVLQSLANQNNTVTIDDSLGRGSAQLQIGGSILNVTATIGTTANTWTDSNGTQYKFTPSSSGATTGTLTISGGSFAQGQIVINNFDLTQATTSNAGYLGIHLAGLTLNPSTPAGPATSNPGAVSVNATSDEQIFTASLGAIASVNTSVTITASGAGASGSSLRLGTGDLSLANGPVTLIIPAGQSSVTVALVDTNSSSSSQTIQLAATLGSAGSGTSISSNSLSVTFNGTPTAPAGTVITGITGTLPNVPAANAPIVSATYYQLNNNNDVVTAGSGSNIIADSILGYEGLDGSGGTSFAIGNGIVPDPYGYAGAVFTGAAGNDTISGGGGSGVIAVGNGNNQIFAGTATSLSAAMSQAQSATASGTNGYYIAAGDGNNTIVGGTGNDYVEVGEGNNTLVLGPGSDTFIGGMEIQGNYLNWSATLPMGSGGVFTAPPGYEGAQYQQNGVNYPVGTGNDTIFGGKGNDGIDLPNGNNYVDAGGGNDTIWASTGSSTIFGGSGNDQILGGGGNDYIDSESGNDSIVGEGGNSTIYGGTGNDTIYSGDNNATWASSITTNNSYLDAGSGNTLLYGAGGNDTLMGGSGNDSLYGGNGNEDIEAGSGTTSMGGGSGNDTLIGGSGADSIFGGSGTDVITAGDGNDSIFGGAGTETITGGAGTDFITAGNGNVTITGGSGYMIITGGSGNDSITTGDGGTDAAPDQASAGSGNTTIVGGAGVNNLFGGAGSDVIYAGDGGDAGQRTYVTAGSGATTIYGGAGPDDITAGAGADVIYAGNGGTATEATFINGGTGTATIYGGAGDAQVSLGGGNDTVITGTGNMSIIGGTGTGTYEISSGSGQVNIYSPGAGDTLEFGAGISIADISAQTANFPGNISGIALTLNGGGQVAIEQGGLSQVSFAGGGTVTFAQLLSPEFTIGNTTYASTDATLANNSPSSNSAPAMQSRTASSTPLDSTTAQDLTLMGSANLTGTGNNVNDVITANAGNDTLIAGTADDTLVGGGASDDYVVSAAAGTVTTIQGSTAADTLSLASGISLSDLSISTADDANGNLDVTIQVAGGGQIVIDGTLNSTVNGGDGSSSMLDFLSFADGSAASLTDLVAQLASGPTAATTATNATLAGGVQNMTLTGTTGIAVTGNDLSDVITASTANDTLIAGTGDDTLVGSSGHTTYMIDADNSSVVITNSGSGDTLKFDSSIAENDLTTSSTVVGGVTVTTIIDNQSGSTVTIDGGGLNQVSFADGNTTTLSGLLAPSYTNATTTYSNVNATAAVGITTLVMTGSSDVTATANNGNDSLISNAANDTLIAGTGNDTLTGGGMSDDYVIANGNQTTTIKQSGANDTLSFGTGISLADLSATTATATDGSTTLTIQNSQGGSVVIDDYTGNVSVDQIQFAGGSTASLGALLAQATTGTSSASSATSVTLAEGIQNMTLTGTASVTATANDEDDIITTNSGNDTLIAGTGNDTFIGGSGATTYQVNPGTGNLVINTSGSGDALTFGTGITEADLYGTTSVVNGTTVTTLYNDQGGTITIDGGGLSQINFADGTSTTLSQLTQPTRTIGTTVYSTTGVTAAAGITDVDLQGSTNIAAVANSGNDLITANAGNDTLIAGSGNDTLVGGAGNTTYNVSATSADTTVEQAGFGDAILFGSGATPYNFGASAATAADGSTTVTIGYGGSPYITLDDYTPGEADQLEFANFPGKSLGAVLAQSTTGSTVETVTANTTMAGGIQNLTLNGAGISGTGNDEDDVITASGANDTLISGTANDTLTSGQSGTTFDITDAQNTVAINGVSSADSLVLGTGISSSGLIASAPLFNAETNQYVETVADTDGTTVNMGSNSTLPTQVQTSTGAVTLSQLPTSIVAGTTLYAVANVTVPGAVQTVDLMGATNISVTANSLNDIIFGSSGNDTMIGGSGNDTFVSGNGSNTYVIGGTSNVTTIVAAQPGDSIEFDSPSANASTISATLSTNPDGSTTLVLNDGVGNTVDIDDYRLGVADQIVLANSTLSVEALLAQQTTGPYAMTAAASTTVPSGVLNLTLTGNAALSATGNSMPNVIIANSGNDSLNAGAANDTLVAGTGNDTLTGNSQSNTTYVFGQQSGNTSSTTMTINGSGSNDVLEFGPGITESDITESMSTSNGVNVTTLTVGQEGTIVINGGNLNQIEFANGSQAILGDFVTSSTIIGITQYSSTSTSIQSGCSELVLIGSGNISGTGAPYSQIYANSGNDTLIAGSGNETLYAGSGNDTLESGSYGNDTLVSGNLNGTGSGSATFQVFNGAAVTIDAGSNDTIAFSPTNENLGFIQLQQAGDQYQFLANGNPVTNVVINGTFANIQLQDGTVVPLASFMSGNYMDGNNEVSSGSTTMQSGLTELTLDGNGNAVATANNLNDLINGSFFGNDTLVAGAGNDTLSAGAGNDTLIGGTGNTTFEFNAYNGENRINTNLIGANGGLVTQDAPNDSLLLNVFNDPSETYDTDAQYAAWLISQGQLTATATYLANGDTQVQIGDLYVQSGSQGIVAQTNFTDGSNTTLSQLLSNNPANIVSVSTSGLLAANVVQANLASVNNLTITANALDDYFQGGGNDTINCGNGSELLDIGNASDLINGGSGKILFNGGSGNDTIVAGTGAIEVELGSGTAQTLLENSTNADTIDFSGAQITSTEVTATLDPSYGSNAVLLTMNTGGSVIVTSGQGSLYFWDGVNTTVATLLNTTNESSSADTVMGAGATHLTLTASGISGTGNGLADTIVANYGNDTLIAGSGLATLIGGAGNETFVVNSASDVITAAANTSNTEQTSVSVTMAANVQSLTGTGSATMTLTGNSANDVITGNSGTDKLVAGSGNDTLIAGSGNDTLTGGTGNDTFVVTSSKDTISEAANSGSNTEDTSYSTTLATNVQKLTGTGSSNLTLTGNSLSNVITADSGNDTLIAGSGVATLVGGAGNDLFEINNTADVVSEAANSGNNTEQTSVSATLAANVQNLTGTGSSTLTLTGNTTNNDVITANTGTDSLVAGSGNDTLVSGSGIDTMVAGAGNDTFEVANASDVITASTAKSGNVVQSSVSYVLPANLLNLTGSNTGSISLTGNTLADTITANSGADTLISGTGIDTLVGGSGNDTFEVNNSSDTITVSSAKSGNVTQSSVNYILPANLLSLTGTGSSNITLTGNTLADKITANTGADTLVSGTGIDTLVGGSGNDTFVINNSSDTITVTTAKAGNVTQSSVNYVLPTNLLNLTGTGSGNISLTGNASADTITANSGADTLTAGSGVATLVGGAGNDTFVVDNASDVITEAANTGNNTEQTSVSVTLAANVQNLTGTGSGTLTLTGNSGNDIITGNTGTDKLVAGAGNDTLIAGSGNDSLTGGAGNDVFDVDNTADVVTAASGSNVNTISTTVSYTASANVQDLFGSGSGSITLTGNSSNDLLVGGSGNETLTGGSATSVLEGGSGNDTLKDTAAANALIAGAGSDTLTGGTGASFIAGGAGNDAITLGSGTAVVAFNTGDGKATIAPGTGTSDVLSLGGGIAYANLSFSKSGNNLILSTGGNNSITFTNWYAGSADQNFVTLQVIEQSASTYSASSTNVLYNEDVEEFSFTQLVTAFNAALAATPSLTSWSLSNALLTDHLSGSNTTALGGDLAYYEGLNSDLTGMNLATAVSTLGSSTYGKTAQTIDAWSGISTSSNRLH